MKSFRELHLNGKYGQGKVSLIDEEDYQLVSEYIWYVHSKGEVFRTENRKTIRLHTQLMQTPKGMVVDHINGNKLDNRRSNLRICTQRQNSQNRRSFGGVSRYKGVFWSKEWKKWGAGIGYNYRRIHLGYFKTQEDAALAYNSRAIELFGEFAKLNEVSL